MKLHRTLKTVGVASVLLANSAVFAADISIGIRSEPSSMDPYFHNLGPNNAMLGHIFGRLVDWDANQQFIPRLASHGRLSMTPLGNSSSARASSSMTEQTLRPTT